MGEVENEYPLISEALIAYLEKNFPNRYPTKELNPYQLGYGAGEQGLISHLRSVKTWGENKNV